LDQSRLGESPDDVAKTLLGDVLQAAGSDRDLAALQTENEPPGRPGAQGDVANLSEKLRRRAADRSNDLASLEVHHQHVERAADGRADAEHDQEEEGGRNDVVLHDQARRLCIRRQRASLQNFNASLLPRDRASARTRRMAGVIGSVVKGAASLAVLLATLGAGSERAAELPETFRRSPWNKRTLSVGAPNDGRLVRGKHLATSSAVRLWNTTSGVPAWAAPNLLHAVEKAAQRTRAVFPGTTTVITALSHEKGGPIQGKRSHQTGRDADIVFFLVDAKGKPATAKQLVHIGGDGRGKDDKAAFTFDDARNWALVEALATDSDKAVTHVFVDSKVRQKMLAYSQTAHVAADKRDAVLQILFAADGEEPLDAMFHLRVVCPEGQIAICTDRAK